jgi:hypothetical protein
VFFAKSLFCRQEEKKSQSFSLTLAIVSIYSRYLNIDGFKLSETVTGGEDLYL